MAGMNVRARAGWGRGAGVALALALCGTAGAAPAQAASPRPLALTLQGLPLVRQTYNACGPASVAMALGYYGVEVPLEGVSRATRATPTSYMRSEAIAPFVRRYGLDATRVRHANINTVRWLLAAGYPVIVLQWLRQPGQIPHFRVVRAFDDGAGRFVLNDPLLGAVQVSYADFTTLWSLYGQELIVVHPPTDGARVARLAGAT